MRLERLRLAGAILITVAAVACSGDDNSSSANTSPTGPSANSGGGSTSNSCRTYAATANVRTTTSASGIVFTAAEVGSFDASTKKATVQTTFTGGAPCSTNVLSYNSVADFVDEVRVIPPVFLTTGSMNTNSGQCGSGTSQTNFTYDGQRRLTQMGGGATTTTYTAWDGSGRPTTGTDSGGTKLALSYDDGARTETSVSTPASGASSTSVLSFDANGIQTSIVLSQGGVTTTTTFTTLSTATVCK